MLGNTAHMDTTMPTMPPVQSFGDLSAQWMRFPLREIEATGLLEQLSPESRIDVDAGYVYIDINEHSGRAAYDELIRDRAEQARQAGIYDIHQVLGIGSLKDVAAATDTDRSPVHDLERVPDYLARTQAQHNPGMGS